MKHLSLLLICSLSLMLTGCGFKLRGSNSLPPQMQQIQLQATSDYDALYQVVKTRLQNHQVTVSTDSLASVPTIRLVKDELERRLLSLFTSGQVAEYELVYTVNYLLMLPDQEAQAIQFDIVREYQDDPNAVLAKSRELDLILKEMRTQAADKIIRQLANPNEITR
ncbi:LPS assembly lipoprotein LptE [Neptunicella marina]|uniref:LPS-assembly lipoprotein LptE n=1 Tax=Neptunicella marina TaxID=2125989 RepID=A0A8J6LVG7_9ALTE|nr:LPS assembly lipoprotein LptE [Neptunicella marina]MBC3764559.1 hypothetical protein [Neptunicella marina]